MRFSLIWITVLIWGGLSWTNTVFAQVNVSTIKPVAINGVIDLRHYQFENNGIVNLDGTWLLYWNEFLTPSKLARSMNKPTQVLVPQNLGGQWSSGNRLTGQGYATYELKILLPQNVIDRSMAFDITGINSAYRMWINAQYAGHKGIVGTNPQLTSPQDGEQIIEFYPRRQEVDLLIQMSNYSQREGGIWSPIGIGFSTQIQQRSNINLMGTFFASGSLFVLGIYQVVLFLFRRSNKALWYLGLTSMITALRVLVVGHEFIFLLIPNLPWEIVKKLQYLTVSLGILYFTSYMYEVYPKETTKYFAKTLRFLMYSFSLFVIATPALSYTEWLLPLQIVVFLDFIFFIVVSFLAIAHQRFGAGLNLFGMMLYSLAVMNEVLYYSHVVPTGQLVQWGFLGFQLVQSILLARQFSETHSRADQLAIELAAMNESLEDKVVERTKQLYQAIAEKSAIIDERKLLIENVVHEIGTPLSKIQGYVKAILDGVIQENKEKYLRMVYDKSEYVGQMVQDLYQLVYLPIHQLRFDMQVVNIVEWAKYIFYKHETDFKSHTLQFDLIREESFLNPCAIYVTIDTLRLEQVMVNLLTNAVKYSPAGSIITLGLQADSLFDRENSTVYIYVADQGTMIPEEERNHIFDRFYRGKQVENEVMGTGLGLAICKAIVHELDGEISVQSDHQGNKFFVALPTKCLSDDNG
jgi:signal transduction histidine kinase